MSNPTEIVARLEAWLDRVPIQHQAWLSSDGAGLIRDALAEIRRRDAEIARLMQQNSLAVGLLARALQEINLAEARADAAEQALANLQGLCNELSGADVENERLESELHALRADYDRMTTVANLLADWKRQPR